MTSYANIVIALSLGNVPSDMVQASLDMLDAQAVSTRFAKAALTYRASERRALSTVLGSTKVAA